MNTDDAFTMPKPNPDLKFDPETDTSRIISVEYEYVNPVWREIASHLPEHMDTPKYGRAIGFLVGLGSTTLAYRILRTLGILP